MNVILFTGAAVMTVDTEGTIYDPGWLVVENDRIFQVGDGEPPESYRRSANKVIEAPGCVVMPGMINAHTHLFQTLFRGLADDKSLLDWLQDCIWPGAVELNSETAYAAAILGLIENLRGGATTVVDHQYIHIDPEIDNVVCKAAAEIGIRFVLARGWADRNYHPLLTESSETILKRTIPIVEKWHGSQEGRIQVGLAPLIPWGCSDNAMKATVEACRSWGGSTHIHCAETAVEVEMNIKERKTRHVNWLNSLELLGPDFQLAHSVWLEDAELDLIAQSGASVVHCPVSNMYLASGVARIRDMLDRNINVALASDGPGSNNRQDMFEACKTTALLQKVTQLNPTVLQPEEVLEMACKNGARLIGHDNDLGVIKPGGKADLIVVNLNTPMAAPVHRIPSALVYCCTAGDIIHSMVDGRLLIENGVLTRTDEGNAIEQAKKAAFQVFSNAGIPTRLT